jgi:uncharacterized protein YndB with AHSA1/START domain
LQNSDFRLKLHWLRLKICNLQSAMRMVHMRFMAAAMLVLGIPAMASAEVVDAGTTGFSIKVATEVNATQATVFRLLSEQIGRWWDSAHTFSGSASNMTIEPRVGGCFCEKLKNGAVQHMIVTHIDTPNVLTLHGGLGPLSGMGVAGAMEWTLAERGGRTQLQVVYNVGGYLKGGFTQLAPVVDGVITSQVRRLKSYSETGRPE